MIYTLTDFDYPLPEELIAHTPASPRHAARLLNWPNVKAGETFADLPNHLESGDVLIFNDSKVLPARLKASRPRLEQEGVVEFEILLHRPLGSLKKWMVFAHPAKRLKEGQLIDFAGGVQALIQGRSDDQVILEFQLPEDDVENFLDQVGEMPLPPYISRPDGSTSADKEEYQTVFCKESGSVAAPTAGLHFSEELLENLKSKGVKIGFVTLHVGAGTFQNVRSENLDEHQMHTEWGRLDEETAKLIRTAKAEGRHIVSVGTTATRVLESAAQANGGDIAPWQGETNIFIRPGYEFKIIDRLITNFHLPKSTLIMLVAAFIGYENMKKLYAYAVENRYKFFSYGDGCLLSRS